MLGEICHDCDDLNLEVKPTLLPNNDQKQLGLFAKSLFVPRQLICEVRGPMLKREHLQKLRLQPTDVLVGTFDGYLIHCQSICKYAKDLIAKPKTLQEFQSTNPKAYKPFKLIPNMRYNARFVMKNHTEHKVFLEALVPIHSGSEIYVRHDPDVVYQKFKCQFLFEKQMNQLATDMKKM